MTVRGLYVLSMMSGSAAYYNLPAKQTNSFDEYCANVVSPTWDNTYSQFYNRYQNPLQNSQTYFESNVEDNPIVKRDFQCRESEVNIKTEPGLEGSGCSAQQGNHAFMNQKFYTESPAFSSRYGFPSVYYDQASHEPSCEDNVSSKSPSLSSDCLQDKSDFLKNRLASVNPYRLFQSNFLSQNIFNGECLLQEKSSFQTVRSDQELRTKLANNKYLDYSSEQSNVEKLELSSQNENGFYQNKTEIKLPKMQEDSLLPTPQQQVATACCHESETNNNGSPVKKGSAFTDTSGRKTDATSSPFENEIYPWMKTVKRGKYKTIDIKRMSVILWKVKNTVGVCTIYMQRFI